MERGDGYFPRWREKVEGVVLPEERLPAGQMLVAGLQHVVGMFGATVLAPLLMGFDPNVAILFSGIATLITVDTTPTNRIPMAIDAAGSNTCEPLSWSVRMPANASPMPAIAAVSSNRTILTLGSRLSRT